MILNQSQVCNTQFMSDSLPLNKMRGGQRGTIRLVNSSELLEKQCEVLGLSPGNEIRILRQARGNGPMQVKSQGSYFAIRAEEAAHIHVQVHDGELNPQ